VIRSFRCILGNPSTARAVALHMRVGDKHVFKLTRLNGDRREGRRSDAKQGAYARCGYSAARATATSWRYAQYVMVRSVWVRTAETNVILHIRCGYLGTLLVGMELG
jgi:hypothetical protein